MTNKVIISIKGIGSSIEEEGILLTARGSYHNRNGKHYIQYDEKMEESDAVINNTIKISDSVISLTKKGAQQLQMVFDQNEPSEAIYQTPYGNLILEINTKSVNRRETPEKIELRLEYSLFSDKAHLSDHELFIVIEADA
jgi:Uncharacterized protein conserved in bacteria